LLDGVGLIAGNLPNPSAPMAAVLLAGRTNIARPTIEGQRSERSNAGRSNAMLSTTELVGESDVALVPRSNEDPELTTGW
jgi:hypothetical protein